jgi:uncharacterized CHY-type Zn-finger protein
MIYNEKDFGKFLYEHQTDTILSPKTYSVWELTILAKYLRQELKKSENEIRNGIIKFCNLNYPGFDVDVEYEKINKVLTECYKTDLRKCNPIPISKSEWENIQKCSTEKIQKLLFVILVVAKFNRLNPVLFLDDNEEDRIYNDERLRCNETEANLYKLMKISFSDAKDKFAPYGELGKQGLNLIEAVNSNKVKRILCFGELYPKEEDVLIHIEDFEKLPDYFLALKENKRIKTCESCQRIFIDNSKNNLQRKCQECKKIKKTKKTERKFCVDCSKEIIIKYNNQASQIRCKECQQKFETKKKVEKYQQNIIKTKTIICEDCKKEIVVPTTYRKSRCEECYEIYRKKKINENAKKYYKKNQK